MFVFVCAGCGATLTAPLSQVVLPAHAHQQYGNGIQLPVLMEPGTFAVDPEPWGPPWRRWEEVDPEEAEARGIYAPVASVSDGAPGAIVVSPGDVRGTLLIPEKAGGYCCGLTGADGPNMACEVCGLAVAVRIDDCSLWQAVWLAPDAVRRLPVDGADAEPLSWGQVMAEGTGTPPFEPVTAVWGSRLGLNNWWSWSPRWEAAAGRALAHLLAASEGRPVTVPDGLVNEVFQRALDALLPGGPPARRAVLAGPGLPAPDPDADILLVPAHPQTGEPWTPGGPAASACPVPVQFGVWRWLAYPERGLPVPASGRMPDGVLRDESPAPHPHDFFRADRRTFEHALVRLPVVRSPWMHEILDRLKQPMTGSIF
ncbi:hypothetical protein ACIBAG_11925 [Streptomyces sp. NPDC051243]|uniref:hypothetical protein n=1 Tax=Streptomyces sp. NPDC051243 TaxID=3365646 RepID=UPI003792D3A2